MAKWIKNLLILFFAIVGAAIWGFVSVALGAPSMATAIGAIVIGIGAISYMVE